MRWVVLRLTAFFACAVAAAVPWTARAIEHIPFTMTGGALTVQATVNNQAAPMLVDLGAGVDVLSRHLGTREINLYGKYVTLSLTGQRVDLPIGTVVSLALGEYKLDNPTVGIWDGLDGSPNQGIVSATAFRTVTATFDYHANQITIEDAMSFPERRRAAIRVPLVLQDELGIALGLFAQFDLGNGQTGTCVVNTGFPQILIDRRFAKKMGVNLNAPGLRHVKTPLGDGIETTIPSLALSAASGAVLHNPTVVFEDLVYDCNVGNNFWSDKVFTLDIPERTMYLAT
ncbi:MAG TPA: retropepsin-like aspartic protease [Candidatus Tumulicola sp.]